LPASCRAPPAAPSRSAEPGGSGPAAGWWPGLLAAGRARSGPPSKVAVGESSPSACVSALLGWLVMHQIPDGHKPGPLAGPAEAGIGASNFLLRGAGSVERQAGIAMEEHIVAGLWRDGHGHGQEGAAARSAGVQQSETALLRPLQFHCCYRDASSKGPAERWLPRRAQGPSVRCWINQKPQATGDNGSAAAAPWPWIEQGRTGGWIHRAAPADRAENGPLTRATLGEDLPPAPGRVRCQQQKTVLTQVRASGYAMGEVCT
jgi:hypothetical protein